MLLEQKAAELKAKEKILMKQLEKERLERAAQEQLVEPLVSDGEKEDVEEVASETNGYHGAASNDEAEADDDVDEIPLGARHDTSIKKDETLTDLHSIVEQH